MISAVILTKNEEENIVDCLDTLFWCDEIVVVDDYSEDRTIEIIKNSKSKIKVFKRALDGDFSAQRNFGLKKAEGEWILFVDADERVSEALISELSTFNFQLSTFNGFYVKRRDFMWRKELKHGETGSIKLLRFAKKDGGEWGGRVHEEWRVKGEIGELKNPLFHYPHQTISEFLREINFYTDIRSMELFEKKIKPNFLSIIAYAKGKFIQDYFIKLGFLDGLPGFIFALMMSFHSFLVRGKVWQLWQQKK